MRDIVALTASEIVVAVQRKALSRVEVAAAHLERVEELDWQVNAFLERRSPDAILAEAGRADAAHGERLGLPLDGVPLSVKDCLDVAGMLRTDGVAAHAGRRSPHDCVAVARLRRAGALVVGKTNQPAFQIRWNTVSDVGGATRNPHALDRSAGGSSGGDAAAVAAGIVALGLGADSGGSIRVPAAFCRVWGLRPSTGRVPDVRALEPRFGSPTQQITGSIGPLARSLDDVERALGVLAGPDPADPVSVPVAPPTRTATRPNTRVARVSGEAGAIVEPSVEAQLDLVCAALDEAGYRVDPRRPPGGRRLPELWATLSGTDLLRVGLPDIETLLSEESTRFMKAVFGPWALDSEAGYIRALSERRRLAQEVALWLEETPLVVAPVCGIGAPPLDFDRDLDEAGGQQLLDRMRNAVLVNILSLPAVALPNGIQLVGRRFCEGEALHAASLVSERLGLRVQPTQSMT